MHHIYAESTEKWFKSAALESASHIPPKRIKLACKRKVWIYSLGAKYLFMMRTVYIFKLRNFDRKLRASLQKILTLNSEKVRVYKALQRKNSDETEFLSSQPRYDRFAYPTRRSTSSLVRRRVRIYSPKAKYLFTMHTVIFFAVLICNSFSIITYWNEKINRLKKYFSKSLICKNLGENFYYFK